MRQFAALQSRLAKLNFRKKPCTMTLLPTRGLAAALLLSVMTPAMPLARDLTATDQLIARSIIQECLAIYHTTRPCACPEDRARNGSLCGKRSAHARPGGARPRCYVEDISSSEIAAFQGGQRSFLTPLGQTFNFHESQRRAETALCACASSQHTDPQSPDRLR